MTIFNSKLLNYERVHGFFQFSSAVLTTDGNITSKHADMTKAYQGWNCSVGSRMFCLRSWHLFIIIYIHIIIVYIYIDLFIERSWTCWSHAFERWRVVSGQSFFEVNLQQPSPGNDPGAVRRRGEQCRDASIGIDDILYISSMYTIIYNTIHLHAHTHTYTHIYICIYIL